MQLKLDLLGMLIGPEKFVSRIIFFIFSTSVILHLSHSVYFCCFNVWLVSRALKQNQVDVLCLMSSLHIAGLCPPPYPLTLEHNVILDNNI